MSEFFIRNTKREYQSFAGIDQLDWKKIPNNKIAVSIFKCKDYISIQNQQLMKICITMNCHKETKWLMRTIDAMKFHEFHTDTKPLYFNTKDQLKRSLLRVVPKSNLNTILKVLYLLYVWLDLDHTTIEMRHILAVAKEWWRATESWKNKVSNRKKYNKKKTKNYTSAIVDNTYSALFQQSTELSPFQTNCSNKRSRKRKIPPLSSSSSSNTASQSLDYYLSDDERYTIFDVFGINDLHRLNELISQNLYSPSKMVHQFIYHLLKSPSYEFARKSMRGADNMSKNERNDLKYTMILVAILRFNDNYHQEKQRGNNLETAPQVLGAAPERKKRKINQLRLSLDEIYKLHDDKLYLSPANNKDSSNSFLQAATLNIIKSTVTDEWKCDVCTFINTRSANDCQMCLSIRKDTKTETVSHCTNN